jgi:hypothetical protein
MPGLKKEIVELKKKILALENKIEAAEKEGPKDSPYIINLGQQLTELMKKENILLGNSQKKGIHILCTKQFGLTNYFVLFAENK